MTQEKSFALSYEEQLKRDRDEIQKRTGRTPEELYEEREKRVRDAIQLKEPDRVPWVMVGGEETDVCPLLLIMTQPLTEQPSETRS